MAVFDETGNLTQEEEERRNAAMVARMGADGVVEDIVYDDYFGFARTEKHFLPDGHQYVEFKIMNEGDRSLYLNKTNRDIRMLRSGEARLSMQPGTERHQLLEIAVVGWNLRQRNHEIPFSTQAFKEWLKFADPKLVDDLVKAINIANPWLLGEMSLEDMRKERDDLDELIKVKEKEEQREKQFR